MLGTEVRRQEECARKDEAEAAADSLYIMRSVAQVAVAACSKGNRKKRTTKKKKKKQPRRIIVEKGSR